MNSFSSGDSNFDDDVEMGMGFGIGGVASFQITDAVFFNPEVNFFYRTLYNYSKSVNTYTNKQSLSEFAISFPLMIQIMPSTSTPINFAGGLQVDLPFSATIKTSVNGKSDSEDIDNRKALDLGIVIGAGYRITQRVGADFRAVIGFTSITTNKNDEDSSYNQYGVGISYFFY